MAGVGRSPLPIFVGHFFALLFAAYIQFSQPFLSDLSQVTGKVSYFEITNCPGKYRDECLALWLDAEEKPFYNRYSSSYKPFIKGDYIHKEITLWYDSKREFHQM
jgi:hypothetical protein